MQTVIVILIVVAAAGFLLRRFYTSVRGGGGTCDCSCDGCSPDRSDDCSEPGPRL